MAPSLQVLRVALILGALTAVPGARATEVPTEPTVLVADGALVGAVNRRGRWSDDGGIRLLEGSPGHMDVLLPVGPDLTDGTVRATVQLGAKPWLTVLTRAHKRQSPDGSLEGLSAVGLTLRGRYVRWDRWDAGVTLPLASRSWVPLAGKRVTVSITAVEHTLFAEVRDALTGTVLVSTSTRDTGSGTGAVGVRVQDDTTSALQALSVTPRDAPPVRGDLDAPTGEDRFVLLTAASLAAAPAELGLQDLGVWPYDDRGLHGVFLPAAAATTLADRGVQHEPRPLVPFWAIDPDVRAAARQVPVQDGWPVLSASYKDPTMVEQVLDAWVAKRPAITHKVLLAVSPRGQPVWGLRIGDQPTIDEDEPSVLISGATHGSELLSTEYALDAAERLLKGYGSDARLTRVVDGLDLWVVPLVNPDGNAVVHSVTRFGGRKNGRDTTANERVDPWEGVDLNRNFPLGFGRDEEASRSFPNSAYYRGPSALSEPESQAIAELARQRHFAASLSFHTNGSMILVPYTLNGFDQPQPNAAWSIAQAIAAVTPKQPNGKAMRVRRQIYPVDGSDQDWMRHTFGTVAYIVEGSHHNPEQRSVRLASVAAVRPMVPALLDRVLDGPRLTVHTVDAEGRPVQAVIEVDAERMSANERWSTRAGDGRHDRLLAAPGQVTVTARAEGYAPASATARVDGVAEVQLVMQPL